MDEFLGILTKWYKKNKIQMEARIQKRDHQATPTHY